MIRPVILLIFILLAGPVTCSVISKPDSILIREINLKGNNQTKPKIILREMKFRQGEMVLRSELPGLVTDSRENIFNTSLFNVVTIDTIPADSSHSAFNVTVKVVERWYVWPIPYIGFPNKNFNAWLETMDWSRLTYGVDLSFRNARGRDETLTLIAHFGYNQKYGFTYRTPYINKQQNFGFSFGVDFTANRTMQVSTYENKNVYIDTTGTYLQQAISGFIEIFFRPSMYTFSDFSLSYTSSRFADTLLTIPGFFTHPSVIQNYFTFWYKFKYDKRDVKYYPMKGFYCDAELTKLGFSDEPVNILAIKSNVNKYWHLGGRWYWASGFTGRLSFPEVQPFYLQQGLGYGKDYVRGFQYYTINGQHFALLKNNLKFAVLPQSTINLSFIKSTKFSIVPFALYVNLFIDAGYVYIKEPIESQDNFLDNRFITGFGIGFDFITYYDLVVGMDFAVNSLWEPGVYLHFVSPI